MQNVRSATWSLPPQKNGDRNDGHRDRSNESLSHPSEGAHTLIRSINFYIISLRYYQEQANQTMDHIKMSRTERLRKQKD